MSETVNVRLKDETGQYRTYNNVGTLMVPTDVEGEEALFYFDTAGGSPSELYKRVRQTMSTIDSDPYKSASNTYYQYKLYQWSVGDNTGELVVFTANYANAPSTNQNTKCGVYLLSGFSATKLSVNDATAVYDAGNHLIVTFDFGMSQISDYTFNPNLITIDKATNAVNNTHDFLFSGLQSYGYTFSAFKRVGTKSALFNTQGNAVFRCYTYDDTTDTLVKISQSAPSGMSGSFSSTNITDIGNTGQVILYYSYITCIPVIFDISLGQIIWMPTSEDLDLVLYYSAWSAYDDLAVLGTLQTNYISGHSTAIYDATTRTIHKFSDIPIWYSAIFQKFTWNNKQFYVIGSMSGGDNELNYLALYNRTDGTLTKLGKGGFNVGRGTLFETYGSNKDRKDDALSLSGNTLAMCTSNGTTASYGMSLWVIDLSTMTSYSVRYGSSPSYNTGSGRVKALSNGDVICINSAPSTCRYIWYYKHTNHTFTRLEPTTANTTLNYLKEVQGRVFVSPLTSEGTPRIVVIDMATASIINTIMLNNVGGQMCVNMGQIFDPGDGYVVIGGWYYSPGAQTGRGVVVYKLSDDTYTVYSNNDIYGTTSPYDIMHNSLQLGSKIYFSPYSGSTTVAVYESGQITLDTTINGTGGMQYGNAFWKYELSSGLWFVKIGANFYKYTESTDSLEPIPVSGASYDYCVLASEAVDPITNSNSNFTSYYENLANQFPNSVVAQDNGNFDLISYYVYDPPYLYDAANNIVCKVLNYEKRVQCRYVMVRGSGYVLYGAQTGTGNNVFGGMSVSDGTQNGIVVFSTDLKSEYLTGHEEADGGVYLFPPRLRGVCEYFYDPINKTLTRTH